MIEYANFIAGPICGRQRHQVAPGLPTVVYTDPREPAFSGFYDRLTPDNRPAWLVENPATAEMPVYIWRAALGAA